MPKYRDSGKSELDSQRALLDSLMGMDRNNDKKNQSLDYRDERVCKFFLCGSCPHEMFVNTKMDEGPCDKIHSDAVKAVFQKSNDIHMYDNFLEKEFLSRIAEADRIIKRARARVEDDKVDDEELNPDINPDMLRIHAEISRVIKLAENFVEIDDIDNAQELMTKYDDLQKEKTGLINKINDLKKHRIGAPDKKLRVCDVCGSYLSIFDSDKRLTDHFLGKQHIGFQYMRDVVAEIAKRREERRANNRNNNNSNNNSNNNNNRRDDYRRDDRDRDRDRDNYNNRDRDRDRDRDNRYNDNYRRDDYRSGGNNNRGGYNNDRDYYRNRDNRDNRRRRSRSRS